MAYVYVLLCEKDGSFYIGSTRDISGRLMAHEKGRVEYTKSRLPVKLMFLKEFDNYSDALVFEMRAKSWKKRKSVLKMFIKEDNIASEYCPVV